MTTENETVLAEIHALRQEVAQLAKDVRWLREREQRKAVAIDAMSAKIPKLPRL
jgi:hypothetical protein